jgi:hypothetical protein
MAQKVSTMQGWGTFGVTTDEILGKHIRDYCAANNIKPSRYFRNLAFEHMVKIGAIESQEALDKEVKKLKEH